MIQVSEEAQQEVRRLLTAAGKPGAGLRLAAPEVSPDHEPTTVEVSVADAPEAGDHVVGVGSVRLFVDPGALAALDGGEVIVSGGALELVLPAQPVKPATLAPGGLLPANTDTFHAPDKG